MLETQANPPSSGDGSDAAPEPDEDEARKSSASPEIKAEEGSIRRRQRARTVYTQHQQTVMNNLVHTLGCCRGTIAAEAAIRDVWLKVPQAKGGGGGLGLSSAQVLRYVKRQTTNIPNKEKRFEDFLEWANSQPEGFRRNPQSQNSLSNASSTPQQDRFYKAIHSSAIPGNTRLPRRDDVGASPIHSQRNDNLALPHIDNDPKVEGNVAFQSLPPIRTAPPFNWQPASTHQAVHSQKAQGPSSTHQAVPSQIAQGPSAGPPAGSCATFPRRKTSNPVEPAMIGVNTNTAKARSRPALPMTTSLRPDNPAPATQMCKPPQSFSCTLAPPMSLAHIVRPPMSAPPRVVVPPLLAPIILAPPVLGPAVMALECPTHTTADFEAPPVRDTQAPTHATPNPQSVKGKSTLPPPVPHIREPQLPAAANSGLLPMDLTKIHPCANSPNNLEGWKIIRLLVRPSSAALDYLAMAPGIHGFWLVTDISPHDNANEYELASNSHLILGYVMKTPGFVALKVLR